MKSESISCSFVSDSLQPIDCSLLGSSAHGILQAGILRWVAIPFSRGLSQPTDGTWVSCTGGGFFTFRQIKKCTTNQNKIWYPETPEEIYRIYLDMLSNTTHSKKQKCGLSCFTKHNNYTGIHQHSLLSCNYILHLYASSFQPQLWSLSRRSYVLSQ